MTEFVITEAKPERNLHAIQEIDNHKPNGEGTKAGQNWSKCECGEKFEGDSIYNARALYQAHARSYAVQDNDIDPILVFVHKKERVEHKFWLYHVSKIGDLDVKNHWYDLHTVASPYARWFIVQEHSRGTRVIAGWVMREGATNEMLWHIQRLRGRAQQVEIVTDLDRKKLDGISIPGKGVVDYAKDLLNDIRKAKNPSEMKELAKMVEELETYVPLLTQAKDEMVKRMFNV